MAFVLSYAYKNFLGKRHIRDNIWNLKIWKRFRGELIIPFG